MEFSPKYIFVFDIETIPDDEAAFNLLGVSFDSLENKRKALTEYHLEITDGKNDFLRQPFHKVVAISFLVAKIDYELGSQESYSILELRSGGTINASEELLVKGFFNKIDELSPRLVSFNGRTFDVPVLKYRAMKHGVIASTFHNAGNKYESYNNRYALSWHCDLIDGLSDFGASAKIKLNEVCAILGLPGKIGIDGSKVVEMFDKGEISAIRDYCETDVLNTYLVYLRYYLHKGKMNKVGYNKAITDVLNFIEKSNKQYFYNFKTHWGKACNENFFL